MTKQALVLSGGGIKGAYQAGAIAEILREEYNFRPTAIYGISVGSINGGMLASYVGQQILKGDSPNLVLAADGLRDYWANHITDFTKLGTKRCLLVLLWELLIGNFKGIVNVDGAISIIQKEVKADALEAAHTKGNLQFFAGTVNLTTGGYFDKADCEKQIVEYVIASGMEPIVMPARVIQPLNDERSRLRKVRDRLTEFIRTKRSFHADRVSAWIDGGVHNVAPLKAAIKAGYDDIVCIACLPGDVGPGSFQGSLGAMSERVLDVVTQTLLNNDIAQALEINQWVDRIANELTRSKVDEDFMHKFKRVDIRLIRPATELKFDFRTFSTGNIHKMIEDGRNDARAEMRSGPRHREPNARLGRRGDQATTG